jgi:stage II sporulation protein D
VIRIGLKSDGKTASISGSRATYFRTGTHVAGIPSGIGLRLSFVPEIKSQYSVQIGSFSTRENASAALESFKSKTRKAGYVFENPDLKLFQVRAGPFSSKELAQQVIEDLKTNGYPNAFYVADEGIAGSTLPELVLFDENSREFLRSKGPVEFWAEENRIGIDGKFYRGYASAFVNRTGRITIVNHVSMEDYLKGVIPNELGPANASTFEALKAQAVAARTYAYKNLKQFEEDGYDLCATPRCQVYSGIDTENDYASRAAEETRGEVITYQGEPINALYTSTCGGRTENAEYMFEGWNYPYLKSVTCYPEENPQRSQAVEIQGQLQSWSGAWLRLKLDSFNVEDTNELLEVPEATRAVENLLRYLGKTSCSQDPLSATDWVSIGEYLVRQLCWQQKRDSLLNEKDYQYFLQHLNFSVDVQPRTHSFLLLFHEGILVPADLSTFNPYSRLKRSDFLRALFQILDHYHQIHSVSGQIREVRSDEIQIVDDTGVHSFKLNSTLFLYQKIGETLVAKEKVVCAPGDRVEYTLQSNQIALLVCEVNQAGISADRGSKYAFWQETFTPSELGEKVGKYLDVGRVVDLQPLSYGVSGRVYEMKIVGTKSSGVLKGIRVRWGLGVKDNLFVVEKTYDPNGEVKEFVFTGRGWGHGLGMCQTGALGYSKAGSDYRSILTHYYSGVQITRIYQ